MEKIIAIADFIQAKPNIDSGDANKGLSDKYVCHCFRKDLVTKILGWYCYLTRLNQSEKERLDAIINQLIRELETRSRRLLSALPDYSIYELFKQYTSLRTVTKGGIATQFSIGVNYVSPVHTDDYYFYTTLSCFTKSGENCDRVLYYFCFPDYGFAVPLQPGDILSFNPLVRHCCTNPKSKEALIFSAYESEKRCVTHVSSSF